MHKISANSLYKTVFVFLKEAALANSQLSASNDNLLEASSTSKVRFLILTLFLRFSE